MTEVKNLKRGTPVLAAALIFMALLLITASYAYGVEVTPIPESVEKARKIIEAPDFPALPDTLNGKPVEELKGYKEISEDLESGRSNRSEIAAYLLIYPDLRSKLEQVVTYMKNASGEANSDSVFKGGLKKIDLEKLIENSPYKLSSGEKTACMEFMQKHLKLLGTNDFEGYIIEDKKVDLKRTASFYSNAVKKTENKIEYALDRMNKDLEAQKEKISGFIKNNIRIEFMIGNTKAYSGVKKNFDENDPIFVGIRYWTEGISEQVPLEWQVISPGGTVGKGGKTVLEPGKSNEPLEILEGKISEKAPAGGYEVKVTLYPGDMDILHKEDYNIGGLPLRITNAFVLNKGKKSPASFQPGELIYLVIRYKPFSSGDQDATFTWSVFDPSGSPVRQLSLSKELGLRASDRDIQTKYIKSRIPDKAVGGTYKYQASVKIGQAKALSDIVSFDVSAGLNVKIITQKKNVGLGQKIVFSSQIIGGKAPYKLLWKFDSGETSDKSNIAIVFKTPGKRWVSLKVVDSSKPKPLEKTVKVVIDVK